MTPATIVTLSSILSYGAPLALAVQQIWSLRRDPPRGDDEPPPRVVPPAPKPLPDCLLPRPVVRVRELEDA